MVKMKKDKNIFYTNIHGGLGNQMFQYAIGRSISLKRDVKLNLDLSKMGGYNLRSFSLGKFNIPEGLFIENKSKINKSNKYFHWIAKKLQKMNISINEKFYEKNEFFFDEEIFSISKNSIDGYWQSYKYFEDIRETLINEFTLKEDLNLKNKDVLKLINSTNSVSIHIRRGDYLNVSKNKSIYNVFGMEYYQKAINYIKENVENPCFFVFSDDINWCVENFTIDNVHYVDANTTSNFECDMVLMSQCEHNIIANSTFSWWGAWLNNNENKEVVAPKKWINALNNINDILPKNWIRL